jgi:Na+:H+ antiporter, NhaA family
MSEAPIDSFLKPVNRFIKNESTGGIILFASALVAIIWANSPWSETYHHLWEYEFNIGFEGFMISKSLHHWINDGLMAMFFFVIGLELKREIMAGELSEPRNAILPIAAAIGGMVVPALLYIVINQQLPEIHGWGIPMATDIAFALGVLALLGKRIPLSLKIFITALAIADDLGAVLVIAFFYTSHISFLNLSIGVGFLAVLIGANLLGVRNATFYGVVGIFGVWLAFLLSGVHSTIAGVLAALTIPARTKIDEIDFTKKLKTYTNEFLQIPPNDVTLLEREQVYVIEKIKDLTKAADTPLQRLEHGLHGLVALVVMPLFALANAGITLQADSFLRLHTVAIGTLVGLLVGKFIGVVGFSWLMVKLKWATLPNDVHWRHIIGAGFLAGIGFTMSLFVTNLAFADAALINQAKLGILVASLIAGIAGFLILRKESN